MTLSTLSKNAPIILILILNFSIHAQKVWEDKNGNPVYYEAAGYKAALQKNFSRTSDKELMATVSNRGPRVKATDIHIIYRGECAKQILAKVNFVNANNPLLEKYKQSGDHKDLPIFDLFKPFIKGVKDQCDDLETIRFETYLSNKLYRGRLEKSNGWKLIDGFGTSDSGYVFKYNKRDIRGLISITHQGTCEVNPTIHLTASDTKARWSSYKKASFGDYENMAKSFVNGYKEECSNVEQINFTLEYIPTGYQVKKGKQAALIARKSNNWEISRENFEYIKQEPLLMSNYTDVIRLIKARKFSSFKDYKYQIYFKEFYTDYMAIYGQICENYVYNPTKLTVTHYRGNAVESKASTKIETRYVKRFEQYGYDISLEALYEIFDAYESRDLGSFKSLAHRKIYQHKTINAHLNSSKCGSPENTNFYALVQALAKKIDNKDF